MSPIGKVFVVLNLLFSLVILGVLGGILAKSEEFKDKYEAKTVELTTATTNWEQELSDKVAQINGHKNEEARQQEQITALEVTNRNLTSDNESLKVDNQQARDDVSKLQADYQKFSASLNELHAHNQQLITENQSLMNERTGAVDAQRSAEEEKARADARVATLTATVDQLKAQIDELEAVRGDYQAQIEAAVQAGFDIAEVRAAPQIDGVVQNVNHSLGLVVLSVGGDDGVARGTTFEIYDSNTYKGKVVVDDVYPDNCSARILRQNGQISVMDKATTRL
ncbi:MAG: hypothetical protein V2A76_01110 [Planctomycetota bacterium]